MSPVFYMFNDRERVFDIVDGDHRRAHAPGLVPHRRRGAGSARAAGSSCSAISSRICPPRLREYDRIVMRNRIFKARTQGVGALHDGRGHRVGRDRPSLRACGLDWDFRKKRPYSGYEQFEFDIPTGRARRLLRPRCGARRGDAAEPADHRPVPRQHARRPLQVGPSAGHAAAARSGRMHDIETLITHFLGVSWGPVIPPGEAFFGHRGHQGQQRLLPGQRRQQISYRTRIRTPSFPHMQMLPLLAGGLDDPRPDHDPRQHRLRDGRRRPVSEPPTMSRAAIRKGPEPLFTELRPC